MKLAYVAGPFGNWRNVRRAQRALEEYGYELTYDWTGAAEEGEAADGRSTTKEWNGGLLSHVQREIASDELDAACRADTLVIVFEGAADSGIGCLIEFGAAAVCGAQLDVIGAPRNSVFWHLPRARVYESLDVWAPR